MNLSAFVGLPWRDRGRDFTGVDCWGLACLVYGAAGRPLPSYVDEYGPLTGRERDDLDLLIRRERSEWREIARGEERALDLVLLFVAGRPSHIGIVAEPGQFLHVIRGQESCIESYRAPKWRPRICGFYRQ